MLASRINQYLHAHGSRLSVSRVKDDSSEYMHFLVHGHSALKDVEQCDKLWRVSLNNEETLYPSGAAWTYGFHGTHVPNLLSILRDGGFNLDCSGDTPRCVCLAPHFHSARSYDFGAMIKCNIFGVQCPFGNSKLQALQQYVGWEMAVGLNLKQKSKGTPDGQLMCHSGNLQITEFHILKTVDIQKFLAESLVLKAGACFLQ